MCKAIVQVEGIRTQALVDFGAQIILIRHQMLPKILRKNKTGQYNNVIPVTGNWSNNQWEQVENP